MYGCIESIEYGLYSILEAVYCVYFVYCVYCERYIESMNCVNSTELYGCVWLCGCW